ncbi:MAG TPA: DUF4416 family protein [Spirochaetota bacterium]|nr:DUF4416 family protein [Spirochaetota bacterium]HNT10089.1 DUF4416 family protein [Spirochaetota bacterium]HNV47245.1 DUF4416 family protein [Spirochaetota bacterium]HOS38822.1 DUF4416 family protein [Spirochaetota bacterium]HPU86906.1 DUF4416 family protein [Spirochaetota bacterium]
MAEPTVPPRAKLFIGVLTAREDLLLMTEERLVRRYGAIDFRTRKLPFSHTDYYDSIGRNLFKVLYSFERLIPREDIVTVKLATNRLEKKITARTREKDAPRRINIDPGYLTLSNVYLASCKEFFHRTYLWRGVYLENEYRYVGRRFQPWEWTYPDYRKMEYLDFFHQVRAIYRKQIEN